MILGARVLCHYDEKKPHKIACDESAYGLRAVLSHQDRQEERPIAFASQTMTTTERNYSLVEREALAIIFAIKKFYQYIWGRRFTLETDQKPLTAIFGPNLEVPAMAAARLQSWTMILSGYSYEIVYRKRTDLKHADAWSRLPTPQETGAETSSKDGEIFHFSLADELPVTSKKIRSATRKEPVSARVYDMTMTGWPDHVTDERLKPYWTRRHELSTEQGCALWETRVVIPSILRKKLIDEIHEDHMGISRTKSVARTFCWWPGLDREIETRGKACAVCQAARMPHP